MKCLASARRMPARKEGRRHGAFASQLQLTSFGLLLALALVIECVISVSAHALEPPRPGELVELQRHGKLQEAIRRATAAGNQSIHPWARIPQVGSGIGPDADLLAPPVPGWADVAGRLPSTGVHTLPAVLIDFTDYPAIVTQAQLDSLLNGPGDPNAYPEESLRGFYLRSSYGALELRCDVLGIYHAPYARSSIDTSSPMAKNLLVEEAFSHFAALGHDFGQYDQNGDGVMDYSVVFWTGPWESWASFWWGGYGAGLPTGSLIDGVEVGAYTWLGEPVDSTTNPPRYSPVAHTLIHETGHALGLPDYYDYDPAVGPPGGVGWWDMMGGEGDHCAFSKIMLGWITPQVVSSGSQAVTLRPSSRYPDAAIVMPRFSLSAPRREFFIVQARDYSANDKVWLYGQGGTGLQVWHVDAAPDGAWLGFLFNNSTSPHKLLRLMEADGQEDIENLRSDPDWYLDLYRGGQSFGPATAPSSRPYWGTSSGVAVTNIGMSGEAMTCNLTAGVNDLDFTAPVTSPGAAGWYNHPVTLTLAISDRHPAWTRYTTIGDPNTWWDWETTGDGYLIGVTSGLKTVNFYSMDYAGNQEQVKHVDIGVDLLPPSITHSGGGAGWSRSSVSVVLAARDQMVPSGSGIAGIEYREGTGAWRSVGTAAATVVVSATDNDGQHVYGYRARDVAGNLSAEGHFTVRIDTTAPTTTATISPAPNSAGWHKGPVTVDLAAVDALCGVARTEYSTTGGETWGSGNSLGISTPGITALSYRSSDGVGNTENAKSIAVRIDTSRPLTKALAMARAVRNRRVNLRLKVLDKTSPKATVTVRIYKGRALKKTLRLGLRRTNTEIRYRYLCRLAKGRYTWKVYATDLAGNRQSKIGSATLTVR